MSQWVVHMDADIYLPPQTRILIERADLDPAYIYGIDRFRVKGYKEWARFTSMPKLQQEAETYIHLDNSFPIGTRVMHGFAGGRLPIGYFQLWNASVSGIKTYPEEHTTAGRGDTLFAEQWPRRKRALIPEIVGYHLESVRSYNGSELERQSIRSVLFGGIMEALFAIVPMTAVIVFWGLTEYWDHKERMAEIARHGSDEDSQS
jgi:hypothetical protein